MFEHFKNREKKPNDVKTTEIINFFDVQWLVAESNFNAIQFIANYFHELENS